MGVFQEVHTPLCCTDTNWASNDKLRVITPRGGDPGSATWSTYAGQDSPTANEQAGQWTSSTGSKLTVSIPGDSLHRDLITANYYQ